VIFDELSFNDCKPDSRNDDYTGKLIIVKASELKPEYRTADSQLMVCSHGNGARPNAKGTTVFGTELYSGVSVCYGRHQIEGIADPGKMPDWAVEKMALIESLKSLAAHKNKSAPTKPTLQEKLNEAKQKAVELAATKGDHDKKPKKRKEMEVK